jgi:hypothetical protein
VLALKNCALRPIREGEMTRPHHYEQCDVPEGMTLTEYRALRRPAKEPKTGLVSRLRRRRPSELAAPHAGHDARRHAA